MTAKAATERLSDAGVSLLVFPAKLKLRCDHAGVKLHDGHEPDVGAPTPDGQILLRQRYLTRCDRFGKVTAATLTGLDDPARVCVCGFNRTIVGPA